MSKSDCFGCKTSDCVCVSIGGKTNWRDCIGYLGCHFRCGKTEVDPSSCAEKFCGAFNNIPNVLGTRRDEILAVHLVKAYSLSSVLYSCETWRLNNTDAKSIDAAWTDVFLYKNTLMATAARV